MGDPEPCITCDGTGLITTDAWSPWDGHTDLVEPCPDCDLGRDDRDEIDIDGVEPIFGDRDSSDLRLLAGGHR